jgi:alkylation response protein AidB-like acyl-CoA dehydrogenase
MCTDARDHYLETRWHDLSPWPRLDDTVLHAIAAYLHAPSTVAKLDALVASRTYPRPIRDRLHALGLADFFADQPEIGLDAQSRMTLVHLGALNYLTASVDTSLSITVAISLLALLPIYIAADPTLLTWVFARVRAGAFGAMLLTEIENGSNLLRNGTHAEPGILDASGSFRTLPEVAGCAAAEASHYRLSGRKDLINGGGEHELLVVFARTRQSSEADSESGLLHARSNFSFLVVERDDTVDSPHRWQTLPVPSANIASVQFHATLVPIGQRIGREGSGFSLAQKGLAVSRGGIGAIAAGLAHRAVVLATDYAQERAIYGTPILQLGAIADHLMRMQALELLVTAAALKATAALNARGWAAAHYGAVAKYACCMLLEELITEGRYLFGSRALLLDHAYQKLIGDAPLLGAFDGTTHLVLDQIQWRLDQLAAAADETQDWPAIITAIYCAPPQRLTDAVRTRSGSLLVAPAAYLRQLAAQPGDLPLQPLIAMIDELLAITRHCRATGVWESDQGLRFEAGKLFAYLETLIALIELSDPLRRRQLGMTPLPEGAGLHILPTFAYGWFGGLVAAALRTLSARVEREPVAGIDAAQLVFGRLYHTARSAIRSDLNGLKRGQT